VVEDKYFIIGGLLCDNMAHRVVEEEEATEEAEQVGREQGEVDGGGAGQLHYRGHAAVQGVHAEGVEGKQCDWGSPERETERERDS